MMVWVIFDHTMKSGSKGDNILTPPKKPKMWVKKMTSVFFYEVNIILNWKKCISKNVYENFTKADFAT